MLTALSHSAPLALTFIDYIFNRITFVTAQFIFPLALLFLYLTAILIPYTLEERVIYSGITFHNAISYVLTFGMINVAGIVLWLTKESHILIEKIEDYERKQHKH